MIYKQPVLVALNEQLDCASAGEDTTGEDTTSNHSADQEDQVGTPESSVEAEVNCSFNLTFRLGLILSLSDHSISGRQR